MKLKSLNDIGMEIFKNTFKEKEKGMELKNLDDIGAEIFKGVLISYLVRCIAYEFNESSEMRSPEDLFLDKNYVESNLKRKDINNLVAEFMEKYKRGGQHVD